MKPNKPWAPFLFAAPALVIFSFAVAVPLLATVGFSFVEWSGYGPWVFVGIDNYKELLTDALFAKSFLNVSFYIAVTLVLEVLVGLCLAGLISARRGGSLWFRVALFAPVMLPMVVVAVLWSFVYNPDFGLINGALQNLGLDSWTRIWLGDPDTALWAIAIVSGWVFSGFFMIIFYAALQQVPAEFSEAATLDGANEWRIFWSVKVPSIRNALEVGVLLCITGGFQGFDLFFVLTNGGPYSSTEIPTTLLVRTVFRNAEVGYGSAMAVVLTVVIIVVGLLFLRLRGLNERKGVLA
jgi:raffinose/stachyose/melibiose transport system permease protein|tara:strand:- start:858 stop:1742 length:885 start_codon:yes stop_codon:yes gene_type:complete